MKRILYGTLFMIILPVLAAVWTEHTAMIHAEAPFVSIAISMSLIVAGFVLLATSMAYMLVSGGGLPMTIDPPKRLVTTGPYALFRHPIYIGFVIMWVGVSLLYKMGGMFWIGTPLAIASRVPMPNVSLVVAR